MTNSVDNTDEIRKLKKSLAQSDGRNGHMLAKNLELLQVVEGLSLAIYNHRLNTTNPTPVDQELWRSLEEFVVFK